MNRDELLALADRCEAAMGPDRELDRAVAKQMGWHRVEPRFSRSKHGAWIAPDDFIGTYSDGSPRLDSLHGTEMHREVPAITASLDAAMTLMPDGAVWKVEDHPSYGPRAVVEDSESYAASPLFALCAAALRAKASQ